MRSRISGGWLTLSALILGVTLGPIGAAAAGSLVEISSPSGRKAFVSRANHVYVAGTSPELVRRGVAGVIGDAICRPLLTAPGDKGLLVRSVHVNIYENPTPGSNNYVALYLGQNGCASLVDRVNGDGRTHTTLEYPDGVPVPAGRSLWVGTHGGVHAEVFGFGYLIPSSAAPATAPQAPGGDANLQQQ